MSSPVWSQDYFINTLLINSKKELSLVAGLGLLQDAAWMHADALGVGYENMFESGLAWVLARQRFLIKKWPKWRDQVRVKTWPRPVSGVMVNRDFEIYVGDSKLGECATSWLTIDLKTRKISRVNPALKGGVREGRGGALTPPLYPPGNYPSLKGGVSLGSMNLESRGGSFRSDFELPFTAPKVDLGAGLEACHEVKVGASDLDMNEHVNNIRYAQWILDAIPNRIPANQSVSRYDVNFLAEAYVGDEIVIKVGRETSGVYRFQGLRKSDAKAIFAAELCYKTGIEA